MAKESKTPYLGLRGHNLIQFIIITVILPTYYLLGYSNAVFGGLLSLESFVDQFPTIDTVHTTGTIVALYTVGCMFGALSCIFIGDRLGRLRTIALGSILEIIGSILLSTSFSLGQLIVGRLVLGYGFGCITATVPIWQSESSPASHRGALVVLEGVFASAGLATSQWIDLGLYLANSAVSWRFPLAFPAVFACVILASLSFLPDSPRWLVKQGRIKEARILAILEDTDESSEIVELDISKMRHSLEEMGKGSFRRLLKNGEDRLLNRTLLAMFSTFSQQINGIGVIGFYTATIFEEFVGMSQIVARALSGSIYIFQLLCCFVTFGTVDRIGRRKLMMFGVTGMGICAAIIAGTVSQAESSEACSIVAAVCVFLFALFVGIGALGINYLYGTEVAPLAYRVPIYALATTTLWSFNFLVVEVTPVAFSNIGYKYFIVFACTNLCLLLPIIYFFLPETQRHSLEDMDTIFRSSKNALDVVRVSREMAEGRLRADAAHVSANSIVSADRGVDEKANVQSLENV